MAARRPSEQTIRVLRSLTDDSVAWRYGYELCMELEIKAGSMYPILIRLADRGFLETKWESDPAPGRPPRHLYRLTPAGRDYAAAIAPASTNLVVPSPTWGGA